MVSRRLVAFAASALVATVVRAQEYNRYAPLSKNISWVDCPGSNGETGYQCGTYDVPLDYNNTAAGKATLALVRYLAPAATRNGTIFLNPGGPGKSGVDLVLESGSLFANLSGGVYDIVGFDPRGVGNTYPLVRCFNSTEDEAVFWNGTSPYAGIETKGNFTNPNGSDDPNTDAFWAQEAEVDRLLGAVGQVCQQANGDILTYVGTTATVRDIAALADYLDGAGAKINYWAFEYGTVIGSYLVNMFPDRVGRVVLDGVINPSLWANAPPAQSWGYSIQDADAVYEGFVSACILAGATGCPLAANETTAQDIKDWTQKLMDASYDYYNKGGNFGSAYVRNILFTALYAPSEWSSVASQLYQIADFLFNGLGSPNNATRRSLTPSRDLFHPTALPAEPRMDHFLGLRPYKAPRSNFIYPHQAASGMSRREWSIANANNTPSDAPLYDYVYQATTCADAIDLSNYTTTDVFNVIVSASNNVSELFGPQFFYAGFWCHKWPVRAVERFTGPWSTRLDEAILVIGNQEDPITPLAGAEWVQENLGASAILVEQNDFGHTSFAEHSDCTLNIITNFWTEGRYPTNDQQCGTNQVLFPRPSITKQTLDNGIADPALDPNVPLPGFNGHGGSGPAKAIVDDATPSGSSPTVTVTVTPTSTGAAQQMAKEIDSLKNTRKTLEIALAALGGAFLLTLGGLIFTALRGKKQRGDRTLVPTADYDADEYSLDDRGVKVAKKSFGPRSAPKKSRGSVSSKVTAVEFDADEDAFLPPINNNKDNKGSKGLAPSDSYSLGAVPASPRASMETLRGYSDPYDPPGGTTPRLGGRATLVPDAGRSGHARTASGGSARSGGRSPSPGGTARPGSSTGLYAEGGQEYHD